MTVCTYPGCDRPAMARGLCSSHYTQQSRGRPLTPIRMWERGHRCEYRDCSDRVRAHGLCAAHLDQLIRTGRTWRVQRRRAHGRRRLRADELAAEIDFLAGTEHPDRLAIRLGYASAESIVQLLRQHGYANLAERLLTRRAA